MSNTHPLSTTLPVPAGPGPEATSSRLPAVSSSSPDRLSPAHSPALAPPAPASTAQQASSVGPRSSYYFGPPARGSAFGTPPVGVIGRDRPREVIRVERDYTAGELCQFHPAFPLELEGRISPAVFGETINDINEILIRAHHAGWAFFDNTLAVLTLWVSPLVCGSKYKREMARLKRVIDEANAKTFNPAGLHIRHPSECAFLFLEVEYF